MKKIDLNNIENVGIDINKSDEIKIKESNNKYIYKCIFHCPINKLDIINSMDIYDDLLAFGTIMGNVYLCHIDKEFLIPKKNNNKILLKEEDDKKSDISDKNTEKNSNDKKISFINSLRLKKFKEKDNLYYKEDNSFSNSNFTYSKLNIINKEIKEKNSEKYSNKINISPKNIEENKSQKLFEKININQEEVLYINKNENLENEETSLIPYPQITQLISGAGENISCAIFDSKDSIIISIGDEELFKMEKISTLNTNNPESKFDYTRSKNYANNTLHLINCENTITFLTKNNFLLINMSFGDFNSTEISEECINYTNKNIKNFDKPEITKGIIESYNFVIPFDFDGSKFLYLEYNKEEKRNICVYDTLSQKHFLKHEIDKIFGHISFMKFLSDNKIFLVRKYKLCEIYKMNDEFLLLEKWEHFGEEIISVQIYLKGTKMSEEFINNNKDNIFLNDESNNDISFVLSEKEDEKIINLKTNNLSNQYNSTYRELKKKTIQELSNDMMSKNDINIFNKYNNKKNKEEILDLDIYKKYKSKNKNNYNEQKIFSIATLDINGNFNLYKNKNNKILFNLYNIEGIEQQFKDEQFFFFGFPYLISMNSKYICISTDQGVFVIKKFIL